MFAKIGIIEFSTEGGGVPQAWTLIAVTGVWVSEGVAVVFSEGSRQFLQWPPEGSQRQRQKSAGVSKLSTWWAWLMTGGCVACV